MTKLDENYFNTDLNLNNTVESFLVNGEKILWRAKPKRSAYVLGKSIHMMPIALLWGAIDFSILFFTLTSGGGSMLFFLIPFFALHLAPVWIWLGSIIKAVRNQKTIQYIITNRRIIEFRGDPVYMHCSIEFRELVDANIKIGVIDKMLKVGDIKIIAEDEKFIEMCDIKNPRALHSKILAIRHIPTGEPITEKVDSETNQKEEYNECEYCGVRVKNSDLKCPNCGAINYVEK